MFVSLEDMGSPVRVRHGRATVYEPAEGSQSQTPPFWLACRVGRFIPKENNDDGYRRRAGTG